MECKICGKDACQHPRLKIHDNIYGCLDCGQCGANTPPIKYALPFYEGKVNWKSDIYFIVCRNCYYEATNDPRAYPLSKLTKLKHKSITERQ